MTSLPSCVICRSQFTPDVAEHVLANAVGWTEATTDKVCGRCNAATAGDDGALARSVSLLTTLIDPTGRRTTAPSLQGRAVTALVAEDSGESWTANPPQTAVITPRGDLRLPGLMTAVNSRGKTVVLHQAPEIRDAWVATKTARGNRPMFSKEGEASIEFRVALPPLETNPAVFRSMGKAVLHRAAIDVEGWDGNGEGTDLLREAILSTGSTLGSWRWDWDLPALSAEPFYHGFQTLACPMTGALVVRLHIYALLRVRFVLSEEFAGSAAVHRTRVQSPFGGASIVSSGACRGPIGWTYHRSALSSADVYERIDEYFGANIESLPGHQRLMRRVK